MEKKSPLTVPNVDLSLGMTDPIDREKQLRGQMFLGYDDLCELADLSERRKAAELRRRNLVYFNRDNLTLVLNELHDYGHPDVDLTRIGYEVDLEQITDGNHLIDWLFHLREKIWFSPQMAADFLTEFQRALEEVVGSDPRARGPWNWKVKKPRKPQPS